MKPFLEGHALRRRLLASVVAWAVGATVLASTDDVAAQQPGWLADRRFAEGPGFRAGNLELHPGIGAEFGYDSNFFQRSDNEDPVGALRLRVTPHFSVSTLGPQRRGDDSAPPDVEFRGDLSATYNEFIGLSGDDSDLMSDQRNVGGLLNLQLKLFPGRAVYGNVHAGVARTIDPNNVGDTGLSFNRLSPNAGAAIGFAPGGGLFDFGFSYDLATTIFEQSEFSDLSSINHSVGTRGTWRFLPKSALFYDTRFNFITYPDGEEKTGSHPLRAKVGYNGLVTNFLGILAAGGWGASFYEEGPPPPEDFDSFIGQVEARFYFTPQASDDPTGASLLSSQMAVGFARDFQDAFIGTYQETNRGYLRFSYFFGGAFLLSVEGGGGSVVFPNLRDENTGEILNPAWVDAKVDAQILGEYRFTDYFALTSTLRYDHYFSDEDLDQAVAGAGAGAGAAAPGLQGELQWQQFQGYLGARLFY